MSIADRYWVGGTDNWNATAGTKWSTTSGGAGGSAVPTAADDVYIDANAGGNVTIPATTTVTCRSLNFVDGTGGAYTGTFTITNSASIIQIGDATAGAGNVALKISSGMTVTLTAIGTIQFLSTNSTTQTITTNGKTVQSMTINGAGSNYQFADAVTSTGNLVYTAGASIDFNSYNHTFSTFVITGNANTRTVTFGTSVISCTLFGGGPFSAAGATNVTISASVGAAINLTNSNNPTLNLGGLNYGNVAFSHTVSGVQQYQITSNGATIYSYTRTGAVSKLEQITFSGSGLTITNDLNIQGNSTTNRILVLSTPAGTPFTITNNGTNTLANIDFLDITGAGSVSWNLASITGNSGDCGGNSGITFTTASPNYWVPSGGTSTGSWSATTRWATSSGGTAGTGRVPLPQDDVYIDANSIDAGSRTITLDMPRVGKNVSFTGATNTPTLSWTTALAQTFYGSVTFISGMTMSFGNTINWVLAGRGSYTFDSGGKTFTGINMTTTVNCGTGTYTLASAYTTSHGFVVSTGTFVTAGYSITSVYLISNSGDTRAIDMTNTTWSVTQATATPWAVTSAGLTLTSTGSTISFSVTSSSTRTFAGAGLKYNVVTYTVAGSTGQMTITGSSYFDTLNFSDVTNARTLALTAGTTQYINTFNVQGTSGKLMTINSTSAGTAAYIELVGALPTVDYLTVTDIYSTIPYKFYAGANSSATGVSTNIIATASVSGPYIVKQAEATGTATTLTPTFAFGQTATANNLLVAFQHNDNDPSTVTTPSGYTANPDNPASSTARLHGFYKTAAGGETGVTLAWTNSRTSAGKLYEIAGFSGTPTLDVKDKNTTAGATSLSTGAGVTNTAQPAIAMAAWAAISSMGATVSFSNSFQEQRGAVQLTSNRHAAKLLTTTGSVTTTNTWTTSRAAVSMMMIFVGSSTTSSFRMLSGMGV